jgi:hypothetical protein
MVGVNMQFEEHYAAIKPMRVILEEMGNSL